ncbi:MAG: D-alanine--D-alanine ligase [Deltaproteobacteria bacterium]|nr:D-alanine--D-alanine ligase [Deltaproteobacteria bacterium]
MTAARVAVIHDRLTEASSKDALDVLEQVAVVSKALEALGFVPEVVPFSLDLPRFMGEMSALGPLFAFNLVESVEGDGRLIHLAPALLEHMGVPYSGSPAEAVFVTSSKLLTKRALQAHGIDTPPWTSLEDGDGFLGRDGRGPLLFKPVWEHASIGMDESAFVDGVDEALVRETLLKRDARAGRRHFAEAYIEGREFNVALLAGEVLPVPEIRFVDYPEGKPKVVDYRAKWEEGSFEYSHTPRSFDLADDDAPIVERLRDVALRCWRLFHLRGYARVDFRVDGSGRPWVLEVNVNPCLSPDAGFYASAERAGLDFTRVVKRIVDDIAR